jgi:hypothetical protein
VIIAKIILTCQTPGLAGSAGSFVIGQRNREIPISIIGLGYQNLKPNLPKPSSKIRDPAWFRRTLGGTGQVRALGSKTSESKVDGMTLFRFIYRRRENVLCWFQKKMYSNHV